MLLQWRTAGATVCLCTVVVLLSFASLLGPANRGALRDSLSLRSSALLSGFFTENAGQVTNPAILYDAFAGGLRLGFGRSAVFMMATDGPSTSGDEPVPDVAVRGALVRITFVGSNGVLPTGRGELPHRSNFFLGSAPDGWRTGVRSYRELVYTDLYDGIDLEYRIGPSGAKYEFVVRPGADPGRIVLSYEGVDALALVGNRVIARTAVAEVVDLLPDAYAGEGPVRCDFVPRSPTSVGIECSGWIGSSPLVIDPLVYSTLVSGGLSDRTTSIAVDASGYAYVSGTVSSADFPIVPGAFDTSFNGLSDAVIVKLDPTGSSLVYATFIGGSRNENGGDIALDALGNVYMTSWTESPDFPTTPGAYDQTWNGAPSPTPTDAYVLKLDPTGSILTFSTFLGGSDREGGMSVALDFLGNVYVSGYTDSPDFPATAGAYSTAFGWYYGFLVELNPSGDALVFSTSLGWGQRGDAVAVDPAGNTYVAGITGNPYFETTPDAFDGTYNGGFDVHVMKFDLLGRTRIYATYVGGRGHDYAYDIAVDAFGSAYVVGRTNSSDFPTTLTAFDSTFGGGCDAWHNCGDIFVTKLDPTGRSLAYSTFLGGREADEAYSVAVDALGRAALFGRTLSHDFPVTFDAYDLSYNDGYDAVFAKLSAAGNALVYSTYLGGRLDELESGRGGGIALGSPGFAYVTGWTDSPDFPLTPGAFDSTFNRYSNSFVTKLDIREADADMAPQISRIRFGTDTGGATVLTVEASDPEGDPLTYAFDFESDGVFDATGPSNVGVHTYPTESRWSATVLVNDGRLSVSMSISSASAILGPSFLPEPAGFTKRASLGMAVPDPGLRAVFGTGVARSSEGDPPIEPLVGFP